MPRRCVELEAELPRKKTKIMEDVGSIDQSFCDDEALPPGIVFTDILQKKWRIGKPIGRGSFGRIYLASDEVDTEVTKLNARYVVKIEPHSNGPLFVEVHCLIRTAQAEKVKAWRLQNKQKRLGMPIYIASGSFTDVNTDSKYRFLVLPRYDIDLHKIISFGRTLDLKNTLVLAIQILDVLEYLHSQGYTHCDIKSSNLMLGFDGTKLNLNQPVIKNQYQKEIEDKKRTKSNKNRTSNYYEDEDFVIKNKNSEDEVGKKVVTRKVYHKPANKSRQFNLRQVNTVNYEDMNSSVCSDDTYQKLLDNKIKIFHYDNVKNAKTAMLPPLIPKINFIKEAVHSQSNGQIYLLDYGLASKFVDNKGKHKEFAMDARKAHDGTIKYSSRDSHIGAHSRRSDLETLGYNLIDWLTGTLPWKTKEMITNPDLVHALKKNFMNDIKKLLTTCFKTENYPQFLEKYLNYVTSLDFSEKPDYNYCKSLFKNEFINNRFGSDKEMCLDFTQSPMSRILNRKQKFGKTLNWSGVKKCLERENMTSLENSLKLEMMKQTLNSSSGGIRKPCTLRNFFVSDADLVAKLKKSLLSQDFFGKKLSPKNLRSNKRNIKKRKGKRSNRNSIGKFGNFMGSTKQFTWAEILAGNPEDLLRKDRSANAESGSEDECKYRIRKYSSSSEHLQESVLMQKDYLSNLNPTYAMKEVLANFKKKGVAKKDDDVINKIEGYTPAMMKIFKAIESRKAKEVKETVSLPRTTRSNKIINNKTPTKKVKKIVERKSLRHLCQDNFNPEVVISPLTVAKFPKNSKKLAKLLIPKKVSEDTPEKAKVITTRKKSATKRCSSREGTFAASNWIRQTRSSTRKRR